ncbi:MAG: prepilin-type N-terminal cleavage/methylation domain-containing protein [Planctomycetota bacterium]
MQTHSHRSGFSLVEIVVVVTVLAMLARMLITTTESMSRVTSTGTIEGVLQGEGEDALRSLVKDLRQSGFQTVGGKEFPYVFDGGAPTNLDFALHAYPAAPPTAQPNDPDFGVQRSLVLVLPSDLDRDGRPELDADLDGWPELDGNGDGVYTDDPADVDHLWDENLNTIHPATGLVWSNAEVSYVVVVLADGSRVLQRRVNNDVATARVVARHVERIQCDTPESSGWTIPLGAVRVRIYFRATDDDGRIYRSRNEVTVRLRNG